MNIIINLAVKVDSPIAVGVNFHGFFYKKFKLEDKRLKETVVMKRQGISILKMILENIEKENEELE
jgi:hypothetical protein